MKTFVGSILLATILSGCAAGLNSVQEREYQAFKQNDVLIEEKDPAIGAVLGILPGGGSFYAGEPAFGVVNLLFWPLSILWDPISGANGAKATNYDITKQQLNKNKQSELVDLENKLAIGQLDTTQFVAEKRKIEDKYTF